MATRIPLKLPGLVLAAGATLLVAGCSGSVQVAPEGSVDFSAPGVEGSVSDSATLPDEWPADVPVPEGLTVQTSTQFATEAGKSLSAGFEGPGDAKAVTQQLGSAFESAGFKQTSSFGSSEVGAVVLWTKGDIKVSVTVSGDSGKVTVSETVVIAKT
ncbi:MAG: hypothetical protein U0904_06445 [Candidatus Nanopelagicales bacterium]|nr:hypothetical protein [Candidatus Nanopelagicales bacterium]